MSTVPGTGPVLRGVGQGGVDEAARPLSLCCQEGFHDRGSPKRRAATHQARLGVANAELLRHLLGGRRVVSIPAALGQLHVEANGGSEVAERVEGSDSGVPNTSLPAPA
jgi:hypothetical protein